MAEREFQLFTGARIQKFKIPEENLLYYAEHPAVEQDKTEEEIIRGGILNPIGGVSLDRIPRDAKVIIIVDDATRPTPAKRILPYLLEQVEKRSRNITFITAPGTHRPMTEEELDRKIGKEWIEKYRLINTDAQREEDYRYIGETEEMKTPLYIHKAVLDADYRIAVGNIGPHNVVGWSGGAKIIQPGVSGRITTEATHYAGSYEAVEEVFGNIECKARKEIDAIGGKVGLDYIANTVLDTEGRILGLFCGHYLKAHRAGVLFADRMLRPEIPGVADIVIVSAYPSCIDYWQGFKPVGFSLKGVRKGGIVIYLFDPPEGLCGNSPAHRPMLEKYLLRDEQTVRKAVAEGEVHDIVGVTNPLCHYQVLQKVQVFCVTNSLTEEECRLLRFKKFESVDTAVQTALGIMGTDAAIGVIPCGGETLVRVKEGMQ